MNEWPGVAMNEWLRHTLQKREGRAPYVIVADRGLL